MNLKSSVVALIDANDLRYAYPTSWLFRAVDLKGIVGNLLSPDGTGLYSKPEAMHVNQTPGLAGSQVAAPDDSQDGLYPRDRGRELKPEDGRHALAFAGLGD